MGTDTTFHLRPRPRDLDSERDRIVAAVRAVVPRAEVFEVGSTAIEGMLGKQDLDFLVRVPHSELAATRMLLDGAFRRNPDQLSTDRYQGYLIESPLDAALQLTVKGGEHDTFLAFADALRSDRDLVAAYNALKASWDGRSMVDYRAAKARFIVDVLARRKANVSTELLGPADRPALFAFLEQQVDTSLILLSNVEKAGLEDHGLPLQATYVASRVNGEITAVAAHAWNGIVVVQGDAGLEDATRAAVSWSGRRLTGFTGPRGLVERARHCVGGESRRIAKEDPEILYALDLEHLRVPALLDAPSIMCRRPVPDESADLLVEWRMSYAVEALGEQPGPALREKAQALLSRLGRLGWVLCHDGRPVSYSTFSASTHGVVQVGGVFTPPDLRGRGYGRAVVAGSLLDARSDGQKRSVLYTSQANVAAQRAYAALGFQPIGDFGLVLFGEG